MRFIIYITLLFLTYTVSAQSDVFVKETSCMLDDVQKERMIAMEFANVTPKTIKSSFRDFLASYNKKFQPMLYIKDVGVVKEVLIPGLSSIPVDIFFKLIEPEETYFTFYLGFKVEGQYINSKNNMEKFLVMKKIVTDFALETKNDQIKQNFELATKKLEDLVRELDRLAQVNQSLHGDILTYKKKITDAEAEIELNMQAQVKLKFTIIDQKIIIEGLRENIMNVK